MDHDAFRTPNKIYSNISPSLGLLRNHATPNYKLKNNFTPNSRNRTNTFSIFPIVNTTPSRFPKVINPFEAALTERLHLPLICSPSLFHRPTTPQNSSSLFEWTIEDVSSLVPANVEPHETQFLTSIDPDTEAKAQAAIDVYFKEHLIVPSPNESHTRKKVILPSDIECRENVSEKRDGISQTELTFPPNLPKEIEDILKPYFKYTMNQQQVHSNVCDRSIDHDARDASLRRKLFNTSMNATCDDNNLELHYLDVECLSPPPKTPQLLNKFGYNKFSDLSSNPHRFSLLSPIACIDNHKDNSFIAISPITKETTIPSPSTPTGLSKSYRRRRYCRSTSSIYRSTSEKIINQSIDMEISFKRKSDSSLNKMNEETKSHMNINTADISDEMQISQVSRNSMTPVRHRHNRHRKNLSRSFSYNMGSDEEIIELSNIKVMTENLIDVKVPLFETDSGFNDCYSSNNIDKNTINVANVSMCNVDNTKPFRCSTPTKKNNLINNIFII